MTNAPMSGANLRGAVDLSSLVRPAASTPQAAESAASGGVVRSSTDSTFTQVLELSSTVPVIVEFYGQGVDATLTDFVPRYGGRLVLVTVDAAVIDYAVRIVATTRRWPGIALGAGPRGSLALVRAARAQAVLAGRDFVTPDDIRSIAKPALRHRIALSPEMQIEGQTPDQVLEALLAKVEAPRQ